MDHQLNRKRTSRRAFTIIELLVVMAIIAILSGIFFGVASGVRERSRISRAQSDLVLLAQYLEQYKAHYGDYPHVTLLESTSAGGGEKVEGEEGIVALYDALNGLRAVDGKPLTSRERAFIDRSKFNHEYSPSQGSPPITDPEKDSVALLDPWGNAYRYFYKSTSTWEDGASYVLYSVGPSGEHEQPNADGYADKSDFKNLDNIYAN